MATQLRLPESVSCRTLDGLVDRLTGQARMWGADSRDAEYAATITRAKFSAVVCGSLSRSDEQRVRAYHAAVLRRRVIASRSEAGVTARRRLVAASIEQDLRSAGWPGDAAQAEAWRQTGSEPAAGVA